MVFETTFTYASATPLPPNLSIDEAISMLHDFETVMKLSPDCRGTRELSTLQNGSPVGMKETSGQIKRRYEVEDDLPFIPKRLWSGGVKYTAEFVPVSDGCDITVYAPCGFTSTNHWRLLRETAPLASNIDQHSYTDHEHLETIPADELNAALQRVQTKDLLHADTKSDGAGWYVEIISDAKCSRTFASFVKGFLKSSHAQLQHTFIDRLKTAAMTQTQQRPQMVKRPTLGRRRSSVL